MVDIRQLVLKITELISIGRESLQHRGVETQDGITIEEIFEKIKEIPIYNFSDRAGGSMTEISIRRAPTYTEGLITKALSKTASALIEIKSSAKRLLGFESASQTDSNTVLQSSVVANIGDLIIAAIITRDTLTLSDDWTLISTSEINSADTTGNGQRLSFAYKYAESINESITVTQATAQRLYINMVALPSTATFIDNGYNYVNSEAASITITKPSGLILWACSASLWSTTAPYPQWNSSNSSYRIDLGNTVQSRLALFLDQTNDAEVTFTAGSDTTTIIVGSLTIQNIDKFYEEV